MRFRRRAWDSVGRGCSSADFYSGRGVGDKVLRLIEGAERRVYVLSPFVSPGYARLLGEKLRRGVDVRVVLSDDSRNREAREILRSVSVIGFDRRRLLLVSLLVVYTLVLAAYRIVNGLGVPFWVDAGYLLALLLVGVRGLLFSFAVFGGIVSGFYLVFREAPGMLVWYAAFGFGIFLSALVFRRRLFPVVGSSGVFPVRVGGGMFHMNIYIIDDTVVLGSPHMTEEGFRDNHEVIAVFRDGCALEWALDVFHAYWRR